LGILIAYWLFIFKIGPSFMKNRKPFEIKDIILVYNLYQVLFSSWLIYRGFQIEGSVEYIKSFGCIDHNVKPTNEIVYGICLISWCYFFNKIVELSDTIFFVLRKKQNHVSFLHVYHHSNMVLMTWIFSKYSSADQGLIAGLINSVIHVIMYSYYFLSALGPSFKRFLFWKKYVTKLQILQFILLVIYFVSIFFRNCKLHEFVVFVFLIDTVIFLYLFLQYYKRTYSKGETAVKDKKQ
jgi:hypothetical protein